MNNTLPHAILRRSTVVSKHAFSLFISFHLLLNVRASVSIDTTPVSTQKAAIEYLAGFRDLKQSSYWLNVEPHAFLNNLLLNIEKPLSVYEGSNTNFCGYAALTYFPLHTDPLGYAKFMIKIYNEGKAQYGKAYIDPSPAIHKAAGTLKFKGNLDVRPADQLWFLSLADHFKGYLNILKPHYKPGFENTFWASVNYAKFNRMVRTLFDLRVDACGYDLIHPGIHNLYEYITGCLKTGFTVLYLNNAFLYRRKHIILRPGIPTHYIILLDLKQVDGVINMTYWDYGYRSLRQITPAFLKKIVFGVSHCTKKIDDKL